MVLQKILLKPEKGVSKVQDSSDRSFTVCPGKALLRMSSSSCSMTRILVFTPQQAVLYISVRCIWKYSPLMHKSWVFVAKVPSVVTNLNVWNLFSAFDLSPEAAVFWLSDPWKFGERSSHTLREAYVCLAFLLRLIQPPQVIWKWMLPRLEGNYS